MGCAGTGPGGAGVALVEARHQDERQCNDQDSGQHSLRGACRQRRGVNTTGSEARQIGQGIRAIEDRRHRLRYRPRGRHERMLGHRRRRGDVGRAFEVTCRQAETTLLLERQPGRRLDGAASVITRWRGGARFGVRGDEVRADRGNRGRCGESVARAAHSRDPRIGVGAIGRIRPVDRGSGTRRASAARGFQPWDRRTSSAERGRHGQQDTVGDRRRSRRTRSRARRWLTPRALRPAQARSFRSDGNISEGNIPRARKNPGDDLFSRKAALSVSSALESLTTVFGMGTGVASPPESPGFHALNMVRQRLEQRAHLLRGAGRKKLRSLECSSLDSARSRVRSRFSHRPLVSC